MSKKKSKTLLDLTMPTILAQVAAHADQLASRSPLPDTATFLAHLLYDELITNFAASWRFSDNWASFWQSLIVLWITHVATTFILHPGLRLSDDVFVTMWQQAVDAQQVQARSQGNESDLLQFTAAMGDPSNTWSLRSPAGDVITFLADRLEKVADLIPASGPFLNPTLLLTLTALCPQSGEAAARARAVAAGDVAGFPVFPFEVDRRNVDPIRQQLTGELNLRDDPLVEAFAQAANANRKASRDDITRAVQARRSAEQDLRNQQRDAKNALPETAADVVRSRGHTLHPPITTSLQDVEMPAIESIDPNALPEGSPPIWPTQ